MSDDDRLITIEELLHRISARCETMSRGNENRLLLEQCAVAIVNLASRLPATQQAKMSPGGLHLP